MMVGETYEKPLFELPLLSITNDPRDTRRGRCVMCTNLDIFTDEARALPYYNQESGDSSSTTSQKQRFQLAHWLPGSTNVWRIFSLGVISGTGKAEVLMKDLFTGGSSDLGDASWLTPANNQSSAGATSFNLFLYYKKTGLIYGARAGTAIFAFDPGAGAAWADTTHSLSYTNIAQGIVHSQDDIAYIPYDNKIASNNNGVWTDAALTLPAQYYITSICEKGAFIAITAAPLSGIGISRVFIWDRNSSLATVTDSVSCGEGIAQVIEEIEGYLISISYENTSTRNKYRTTFRVYTTFGMKKFFQITTSSVPLLTLHKQKADDRIYFQMTATIDGINRDGIWSIYHLGSGSFGVAHEQTTFNDTVFTTNTLQKGFFIVGDYRFISYVDDSGNYQLSKTNDQANYPTSIIETTVKNNGDPSLLEKLIGITCTTQPLPSGGKVIARYKKDSDTKWTQIFSNSTLNSMHHSANCIEDLTPGGDVVTMTIASPAVITLAAHGLIAGDTIKITTTGALPTGITAGTTYYVISAGLATNTFEISATSGGSAINTSGSQSGTHTMTRAKNFNEGQEYHFRLEYSGGAVPTGASYKSEIVGKRTY